MAKMLRTYYMDFPLHKLGLNVLTYVLGVAGEGLKEEG